MQFSEPMELDPFRLVQEGSLDIPVIFSSPHSGRYYPPDLIALAALDKHSLRRSEDVFVDQLISSAPQHGIPLIAANYARAYIDLNREPYELDQSMFEDRLPAYTSPRTARVAAGLGSVARVVADGMEIYQGKLMFSDARNRIEKIHQPYHEALQRLISATQARMGFAILFDWHSMPSAAAAGTSTIDMVLGDRFGRSCAGYITSYTEEALKSRGFTVARNHPYAGGYTAEYYGRPDSGVNVLQIEMNRNLYLNEATFERSSTFLSLAAALQTLIKDLAAKDWLGTRGCL